MARFLLVLKPAGNPSSPWILEQLLPVLEALQGEVDHRTPAHLSALLKGAAEVQRMQLFADVQAKEDGAVLELVLLSREAMGTGAPETRAVFRELLTLLQRHLSCFQHVFRSDRDGALPQQPE
ncbi:MAG: hypothetical protein VKK98_07830 [Cyanobacteriota bacterium]|nr:hypothetical protein [Cyanobacteriota bacterium]